MEELAYKPQSLDTTSIIEAPKEIDKPDYPDVGVKFAGYSKIPRGGKDFELKPQIRADINYNYTFLFGDNSIDLNRANGTAKDFYCTDIYFNYHNNGRVVGSVSWITLRAGAGGPILLQMQEPPGVGSYWDVNLHFDVPLFFPKGTTLYLEFSVNRIANEAMGINYYGWEE